MANAASTIEIELEIRDAINRLGRLERELTKSSQSFDRAAQATRKFEGAINKAKAGMVAFFAAISLQKLAQLSDAMTQFENRVKLATNSLVQQLAVQQELFGVAQRTGTSISDVSELYSRMRLAAEQLRASQRDLINVTETVGLTLKVQGTSATEASGALQQLGQAFNSPIVQAEEFNSLQDALPALLKEVTKNLGLQQGQLKKYVNDQKLSNKDLFDAILASQKALTQQANSSASTIEQANQRVANSFTSLIGAIDDKLGASKFFTGFIDGLASGIDKLSNFLGLTTQATGGGGGGANLDEVIRGAAPSGSQYAFPTIGPERITESIGRFPNYVQEINSLEELISLEEDLLFIREDQAKQIGDAVNSNKETVEILGTQNVPLKEAVGYINFENKLLDSIIQKRRIELQQNKENLTYLEQATNYLKEQFGLTDRTAGAIVSGISAAGPNASRGMNIAQSKSLDEAAYKLILSNEKVAAAIDKSFELLFDVLDPFIDLLGDLISAINRLIEALAKGIGDGIQSVLDQAGVGQDSYLFGGGFASDFEQFSFDISGGMFGVNNRPTGMSAEEFQSFSLELWQRSSADAVSELLKDLGQVGFSSIREGVESEYQKVVEQIMSISSDDISSNQRSQLLNTALEVQSSLLKRLRQQYEEISNKETISLLEEINERGIQRNEIDQIRVNYQKEIQEVTENLLLTEKDQIQVIKALEQAREREIQAIERQQTLSNLQTGGNELQKILSDFEDTFERIIDLVQGLRDQAAGLIYGSASVIPASARFASATTQYQELLAAALDPEATEENVKEFQAFVDTYLKGAQDVFKSSSRYQNIFNSVLSDLEQIANFVSIAAPINEIESVKAQLIEVAEEFGVNIEEVITGLDQLSRALIFRALVVGVPVQTVVDTTNSDLVIEAIVTAVEDPNLSDTQIEAIVTAAQATGSDTIIEAVVTAVADSQLSNTEIQAIVTAVLGAGSDTQIEAQVSAIASNTPLISAIVDAVAANIPTITADINLDISGIQSTMQELAETLQSSIDRLVASLILQDLKVASAGATASVYKPSYASGIYSTTDTTAGYSVISSSFSPSVTGQDYQNQFSWDDLTANEQFFALYNYQKANDTSFISKPYFVLRQALSGSGFQPYLYAFDQLADAQNYYDLQQYQPGDYAFGKYNLVKYGFRRGGIVDPLDTIPAMLSPGEYILSPETVRRYGVSNLNRLNSGDTAALNATSDPEVKRLLAELIVAVRENDTEVNVYTDMAGQTKAGIEEFRSELRERTRRQGDKFLPARYI